MATIKYNLFTQDETELVPGIKVKDFLRLDTYKLPVMDGKKQAVNPSTGKKIYRALTPTEKVSLHEVRIHTDLIKSLKAIQTEYPGWAVGINDHGGYRPNAPIDLNSAVGGAKGSQHRYGNAADFYLRDKDGVYMDTAVLAVAAERIMQKNGIRGGVGIYPGKANYIHVDCRGSWAAWFKSYDGKKCPHQGGIYTPFKKGHETAGIVLIQRALIALGGAYAQCAPEDGIWGAKTEAAVRLFQQNSELKADGIAGWKTIGALCRAVGYTVLPWE